MVSQGTDASSHGDRSSKPGICLTFAQLLVFAAVLVPALVALRASMATIDLAYQIRAGEVMLNSGHVLRTDLFTFTEFGQPWLNQQWGAQILLALLYRAGSWKIIALTQAAFAAASLWLVYIACRARGAGIRPAAWLSLGGLLIATYGFAPRPQMFGFLLFAVTLAIVATRKRHPRLLWLLPGITLVWANLHGSFILPPIVLLLAWLEDRRKRAPSDRTTFVVAIACVAAATVNPYGLRVWQYVVELSANPEVRQTIDEWQPPRPTTITGFAFFMSVAIVVLIVIRRRRFKDWPRVLGLVLFFLMGVTAVRGIIWWALAAPVLIADLFPGGATRHDEPRLLNTVLALCLAVLGVLLLPWFRPTFASSANSGTTTNGLLAFAPNRYSLHLLEDVPPGARVFAAQIWSSWFELTVPRDPVMIDPRIEIFSRAVWRDYDVISDAAEGWQQVLDRWDIDVLALSRDQQPRLIAAIRLNPNWTPLYEDDDGILLVRNL